MIRRTALRTLTTVVGTAPPALSRTQGARATTPAAVAAPEFSQARLVDTEFLRSHARVEVRYGDPDHPDRARVVTSATTLM
ncbi:hypothetical protein [Streptomyces syringium]|uniref:hypothetical protein n=1 Tax=Streptomyces syringium TaxID=76729 RepID=UPI0033E9C6FE